MERFRLWFTERVELKKEIVVPHDIQTRQRRVQISDEDGEVARPPEMNELCATPQDGSSTAREKWTTGHQVRQLATSHLAVQPSKKDEPTKAASDTRPERPIRKCRFY